MSISGLLAGLKASQGPTQLEQQQEAQRKAARAKVAKRRFYDVQAPDGSVISVEWNGKGEPKSSELEAMAHKAEKWHGVQQKAKVEQKEINRGPRLAEPLPASMQRAGKIKNLSDFVKTTDEDLTSAMNQSGLPELASRITRGVGNVAMLPTADVENASKFTGGLVGGLPSGVPHLVTDPVMAVLPNNITGASSEERNMAGLGTLLSLLPILAHGAASGIGALRGKGRAAAIDAEALRTPKDALPYVERKALPESRVPEGQTPTGPKFKAKPKANYPEGAVTNTVPNPAKVEEVRQMLLRQFAPPEPGPTTHERHLAKATPNRELPAKVAKGAEVNGTDIQKILDQQHATRTERFEPAKGTVGPQSEPDYADLLQQSIDAEKVKRGIPLETPATVQPKAKANLEPVAKPGAASKEPWEMTWQEHRDALNAAREATPGKVATAEAKYQIARDAFDAEKSQIRKRINAISARVQRLNPTGDISEVDTASRRIIEKLNKEWGELSAKSRQSQAPIRSDFVAAEIGDRHPVSGQYQHKNIVQQALSEGKPVPAEVLADYPELKTKANPAPLENVSRETMPVKGPEQAKTYRIRRPNGDWADEPTAKPFKAPELPKADLFIHKRTTGTGRSKVTVSVISDARTGLELTYAPNEEILKTRLTSLVDRLGPDAIYKRIEDTARKYGDHPDYVQPETPQPSKVIQRPGSGRKNAGYLDTSMFNEVADKAISMAKKTGKGIDEITAELKKQYPDINRVDVADAIKSTMTPARTASAAARNAARLKAQARANTTEATAERDAKAAELIRTRNPAEAKLIGAGQKVGKGILEGSRIVRAGQLGGDFGIPFRQGLTGLINDPVSWGKSWKAVSKVKGQEQALSDLLEELHNKTIRGNRMGDVRNEYGLNLTDAKAIHEEGYASKLLSKLPGWDRLERGQTAFINNLRAEMFDKFYAKHPDALPSELREHAKWINTMTGRSNMTEVQPWMESVFTSPRWTKSRWEMVGQAARSPETLLRAGLGNKAAQQKVKDLGRMAAYMYATYKVAEANGAKVDLDPKSAGFLKVQVGSKIYDPTAGVAGPIRTALRLALMGKDQYEAHRTPPAMKDGKPVKNPNEWGFGKNPGDTISSYLQGTISPSVTTPIKQIFGKSLSGYDLDENEKGLMGLSPMIVQTFVDTLKHDGIGRAIGDTAIEGFGINSYRMDPKQMVKKPTFKFKDKNGNVVEIEYKGEKARPTRTWFLETAKKKGLRYVGGPVK